MFTISQNQNGELLTNDQIDIYSPDLCLGQKKVPVIFYIHGGAWHIGDRKKAKEVCENLAESGYVCVATSYRLSGVDGQQMDILLTSLTVILTILTVASQTLAQMVFMLTIMFLMLTVFFLMYIFLSRSDVEHPDHIQDVAQSFKWVVENVSKYGGDINQIFVMGHSSGGHLATLLSTNTYFLEHIGVDPSMIKGCISLSGVYSDVRLKSTPGGTKLLKNAFGDRKTYYDAFPIYNITDKTPPTLLINAGLDIGLKRHTLDYHYALKQAGVYVKTSYFENMSHCDIHRQWKTNQVNSGVLKTINKFICEVQESL